MVARSPVIPSYRHHKPSAQAVVTLNGHDIYLGPYGSAETLQEYDRLIHEWLANSRVLPSHTQATTGFTVAELIIAYYKFAQGYFLKNGQPTSEVRCIRLAMCPLRRLYGHLPVAEFGPLALKAVREVMLGTPQQAGLVAANLQSPAMTTRDQSSPERDSAGSRLCRSVINHHIGRIKRMFKWGTENELVPSHVFHALQAVSGIRFGRGGRETEPVRPVPEPILEATLPHLSRHIRAMVDFQLLTGVRPGEVCALRLCDVDRSRAVWVYRYGAHKTVHHGHSREIRIGPKAQKVILPFLKANPEAYVFDPRDAVAENCAERRAHRQSPMTPSQNARKPKLHPKRSPQDHYTTFSYRRAIARACDVAFPPPPPLAKTETETAKQWKARLSESEKRDLRRWLHAQRWHPHQLRHNAATRLRAMYGIDVAKIILGHHSLEATEIYAEQDVKAADRVMAEVG